MKLTLTLWGLLASSVTALAQNPYVVQLPYELKSRERELAYYLRDKGRFKAEMEKIYLDLKKPLDADTYPQHGNRDGKVSLDEAKKQIMRLPSNRSEFGGNATALQTAAEGVILGWEYHYPDDRPGDKMFDLSHAIRNKMQALGGTYAEEFGRISRHFEDYRKHVIANGNDPRFLPQFNASDSLYRNYTKEALKKAKAAFDQSMKDLANEEKKLAQQPPAPADLLQFIWQLITTAPSGTSAL